jgi:putative ABC transport system ATP-binding protein
MSQLPTPPLVCFREVTMHYPSPGGSFTALDQVSFQVSAGAFAVVLGPSGSGKSTLLGLLGGLERPTSGEVIVDGTALHSLPERRLGPWRGQRIGIVFQFFQLIPTLTALDNVLLPMDFARRWPHRERLNRAMALLDRLGVADQAGKLPNTLSGGQQQRVALARALANSPPLLLADEPTGNLDSRTAAALFDLLASLVADGQTVVMVTHDVGARSLADQVLSLSDGRLQASGAA